MKKQVAGTGAAVPSLPLESCMKYKHEFEIALRSVQQAYILVRKIREGGLTDSDKMLKPDDSPVTVADLAAQAVINYGLSASEHPIVAEEDADELRKRDDLRARVTEHITSFSPLTMTEDDVIDAIDMSRPGDTDRPTSYWTVDPIDGTAGFIRPGRSYTVALALVENGEPVIGVLGCDSTIYAAIKGEGSRLRPLHMPDRVAEIKVNKSKPGDDRPDLFCQSYEESHTSPEIASRVAEILGVESSPLRIGGQGKYAAVARGRSAVYMRISTKPQNVWDHAAGCIVVTEAGGVVSDTDGNPLDFSSGRKMIRSHGIVATNGLFHQPVIDAIKKSSSET